MIETRSAAVILAVAPLGRVATTVDAAGRVGTSGGVVQQRPLVGGVQRLPQVGVHQDDVAPDGEHSAGVAPASA